MAKEYNHLTLTERDKITTMLYEHTSLGEIALALGRSKSTLSREIKRNASPEYQLYLSHRAHGRSEERRKQSSSRPRLKNKHIVLFVAAKLQEGWSPEQIAGRLPKEHPGLSISHEAIDQYIYHPKTPNRLERIGQLRRAHRKRKAKGVGRSVRKTKIPNRISIEQRPSFVQTRKQIGHWEGDSLVSRKSLVALNSLVERKSRLLKLTKLPRKSASDTVAAVVKRLKDLPRRGQENLDHGQRDRKCRASRDDRQDRSPMLFRPSLCLLGARNQRKYKWPHPMVLAKGYGLQYDHHRADRKDRIITKQPPQKMSGI